MLTQSIPTITLESDIAKHVHQVYENIFRASPAKDCHGLQHAIRGAIYASVFANLYRKYGNKEALALKEMDIKLLQITMLFHDSARQGEEEDKWEKESAANLYNYLVKQLKADREKAKELVEAVANKDLDETGYLELEVDSNQQISWKIIDHKPKNTYQKIIHDADCLDIIRARHSFDATYLDFYKEYVVTNVGDAFEDLAQLIAEATRFIEIQGDGYQRLKKDIKKQFEQPHGMAAMCTLLTTKCYPILSHLGLQLVPEKELTYPLFTPITYDPTQPLTDHNLQAAMQEGRILARGISSPSAVHNKSHKKSETYIETELRKVFRVLGIATPNGSITKQGNPNRSTSLLAYSGAAFACSGYFLVNFSHNAIRAAYDADSHTGYKKKNANFLAQESEEKNSLSQKVQNILRKQKMGGKTTYIEATPTKHSEIIIDINKENIVSNITTQQKPQVLVYFTNDPCFMNPGATKNEPTHKNSPLLQAVFIQKQFEHTLRQLHPTEYQDIQVVIVEQSSLHNFVRNTQPLNDEELILKWCEMCSDFMQKKLAEKNISAFYSLSLDNIKTLSMYNTDEVLPADINYSCALKEKLNHALEKERERLVASHIADPTFFAEIITCFKFGSIFYEAQDFLAILKNCCRDKPFNEAQLAIINTRLQPLLLYSIHIDNAQEKITIISTNIHLMIEMNLTNLIPSLYKKILENYLCAKINQSNKILYQSVTDLLNKLNAKAQNNAFTCVAKEKQSGLITIKESSVQPADNRSTLFGDKGKSLFPPLPDMSAKLGSTNPSF